jgi:hypothetical protein
MTHDSQWPWCVRIIQLVARQPYSFHETIGATVVQSKTLEAVEAASSEKLKDPSRTRAQDAESFARDWTLDSIQQT